MKKLTESQQLQLASYSSTEWRPAGHRAIVRTLRKLGYIKTRWADASLQAILVAPMHELPAEAKSHIKNI